MIDYGKQIRQVTDEHTKLHTDLDRTIRDLGSQAVELDPDRLPDDAGAFLDEYRSIRDELENASSAIERMMNIDARQNEIKSAMKALQNEHDELGRGLSGVYEQIGAVAFRLFRESPLIDAGYSSAFEGLARYQDEVRSIENRLNQIPSEESRRSKRGILERIRESGKGMYLRKRRNAQENRLPSLLQEAGERLAHSEFIAQVDDEELNRVSEPLRTVQSRWTEIDRELQDLTAESGRLVEEFNSISGGRALSRARSERESEISNARNRLNGVFLKLGNLLESTHTEHFPEELTRITQLRGRLAERDDLLKRLRAGQELETVRRDLNTCLKRQEKTRKEISELEEQLRVLGEEEAGFLDAVKQLETERGDPTELIES